MSVTARVGDDWDRHWQEFAESASLNPGQHLRRQLVSRLLGKLDGSVRLLDIGSGQGDLLAELRDRYPHAELVGIDSSRAGLAISAAKVGAARFYCHDLLRPGSGPPAELVGWATHAVCSEVLEHVDDPRGLLVEAARCMAPGCRLVVTVPGGPMSAFDRHIGHRRHFSPASLGELLSEAGLEVEGTGGAGFPFFNLYRLVVILRGRRLAVDVAAAERGPAALSVRLVTRLFRLLFVLNRPRSPRGWQVFGVARKAVSIEAAPAPG